MQIITKPKVQVFSRQVFIPIDEYPIPSDGNDAVKIGAFAAKGCYDSFSATGRANEANQRGVMEHRHGSVAEHVAFGLYITGITRACSLESNRHRQLAVSQRSTRYTREEDSAIVLDPYYAELWNKYPMQDTKGPSGWDYSRGSSTSTEETEKRVLRGFLNGCEYSIQEYQRQVENLVLLNPLKLEGFDLRKWARGKARNVLPHALETRIAYTGNVRAWRWFLEVRSDKHAEPEIRRLANEVYQVLLVEAPVYFDDFYVSEVYDGIPVLKTPYSKI